MASAPPAVVTDPASSGGGRVLDPIARTSEILFGLIMALTFTGTLGVATAGRDDIRMLIIGIIGCNIAWGIVDAVMFIMSEVSVRGRGLQTIRAVRDAETAQEAHRIIGSAMPPVLASIMAAEDFEKLRRGVVRMRDIPASAGITYNDWTGALAVFLLVCLSTFPVVIPFLVISRIQLALRLSNLVAIVMLFALGYRLGRHSGHSPWRTGASMVLLGLVLVGIALALGG
jgi:VIT1/CCC1 family predicted Fe2+/Mn2+ transporter